MSTLEITENNSTNLKFERSRKKELISAVLVVSFFTLYYFMLFKHGATAAEKVFENFESVIAALAVLFAPLFFLFKVLKPAYKTFRFGEVWCFDTNSKAITKNGKLVLNTNEIVELRVKKYPGSDAPDSFEMAFTLADQSSFHFEDVYDQEQAEEFSASLEQLLKISLVKDKW